MPVLRYPIQDLEQTVSRPTAYQVIQQIKEILSLPNDIDIIYISKRGSSKMIASTIDRTRAGATFAPGTKFIVSVTEDLVQEAVQEFQPMTLDNAPILEDNKIDFSVRPAHHTSKVEISITYQHTSETEIKRWIAATVSNIAQGRDSYLHDITYSYPIPLTILQLAHDINVCREAIEPYGDSLEQYIKRCQKTTFTVLVARDGKEPVLAVKEKQGQIVGQFSFTVMPDKPTHNAELGLWESTFTYTYSYERPENLIVRFPVSVHNQFLPEYWFEDLDRAVDYQRHQTYQSRSYTALQRFSNDTRAKRLMYPDAYIQEPRYDDFGEHNPMTDTVFDQDTGTIMVMLCMLEDDKKTLMDLHDIGDDYYLDEDILEFFKSECTYLTKLYFSVYQVSIYRNGVKMAEENVEVTPDLIVRCKTAQSARDQFHVRLSASPVVSKLLYAALQRLRSHPRAYYKTIKLLNEILLQDPDFENWEKSEKIEDWMFEAIWRVLTATHQGAIGSPGTNLPIYAPGGHLPYDQDDRFWGLLKRVDPNVIKTYLERKRVVRFTHMNGYLIAKPVIRH